MTEADPYAVLIASPGSHRVLPWRDAPPCTNRAIKAEVEGVTVVGLHAPLEPKLGRPFYEWLGTEAAGLLAAEALLIGDFNADRPGQGLPLEPDFERLINEGWVHALRVHETDADHSSWWHSGGTGFSIDHGLISPVLAPRFVAASVLADVAGAPTAGPGLRTTTGALSDHRPLVIDLLPRSGAAAEVSG